VVCGNGEDALIWLQLPTQAEMWVFAIYIPDSGVLRTQSPWLSRFGRGVYFRVETEPPCLIPPSLRLMPHACSSVGSIA
jgi:hypothetical protein